jgi:hypothetical protein
MNNHMIPESHKRYGQEKIDEWDYEAGMQPGIEQYPDGYYYTIRVKKNLFP